MATRYYSFAEGEYYHLYNRGNSKQLIFKDTQDYKRFLQLLYISNCNESFKLRDFRNKNLFEIERGNQLVHIGAYCLMPNHFHLLVTPASDGSVPELMLKLSTAYASYFNKKYERVGSLFEGSYRAKYVNSDRYLKYLFSYIHLNPFRVKNQNFSSRKVNNAELMKYHYSSLPDYLGAKREASTILSPNSFPRYFDTIEDNTRELYEWLSYEDKITQGYPV